MVRRSSPTTGIAIVVTRTTSLLLELVGQTGITRKGWSTAFVNVCTGSVGVLDAALDNHTVLTLLLDYDGRTLFTADGASVAMKGSPTKLSSP